jgi:hypothetical protein
LRILWSPSREIFCTILRAVCWTRRRDDLFDGDTVLDSAHVGNSKGSAIGGGSLLFGCHAAVEIGWCRRLTVCPQGKILWLLGEAP